MDNDLNRSLRLLENALASPGKSLLMNNTTYANLSLTMTQDEMEAVAAKRKKPLRLFNDTTLDLHKSVTGSIIQAEDPWMQTVEKLYMEFFEIVQGQRGTEDAMELVSELARCCSDALKVIRSLKSKVSVGDIEEEAWLTKECHTWRLLFILYQDRLLSQNLMDEGGDFDVNDMRNQYYGKSEKRCAECLFKRDSLVRECQLVIDWLECQEAERDDQILHFSDSTIGWENTLHQLQCAETIAFGSTRQIVTKMDPDAPHYQKKPLHDLDTEDEKGLSRKVFREVRCGKLDEAEKLCRQCGHSWKAAIYEGWRLYHNPNIKEKDSQRNGDENHGDYEDDGFGEMETNTLQEIEGNASRDLWKLMAIRYCNQDYLDIYDRASLGCFAGYLEAILPVCTTWEDNLWAYMKSMVDIRVESEIRDCVTRIKDYIPLPDEYWHQRLSLNEVFGHLESSKSSLVREHSREPQRLIQKHLILDDMNALFNDLEQWADDGNVSTHFLRFAAHAALFLDQIGKGIRSSVERIVQNYIKRLMLMHETQLVVYYVSKLSIGNQIPLYAQYLEQITDNTDRKNALFSAEECGLDVFAITKLVVENIRSRPHEMEASGNLQHKLTDTDKFKISGLDWLLFYEQQLVEALRQTNALIFTFLTLGKVDAAQLAFNKIPADAVKKVLDAEDYGRSSEMDQVIKSYLCYKSYLDASEAFNEWFKQSKNKPAPPDVVADNAGFPEKVAYQHRMSQYSAEIERWKLTTNHLAKTAKTKLYNVLLFPEGWLVGAKDADFLRSNVIPEVAFLLYSVLHESGLYGECIQLADVVASERYGLYKVYSKEKLGEFLEKLCESSVVLLKNQEDPWGDTE